MIVTNSTNLIYLIHFSNFNFFVICYFKLFITRNFIQSSIKIYEHLNKKCNVKIISKKKKSSYYEHNKNIMEMDQMHLGE